jgi:hypothetical protein
MKKIKSKIKQEKVIMSKNTKLLIYVLSGIILLVISIMIMVESAPASITIRNKSSKKLEYVKSYFVNEQIDLTGHEANLEIRFKFEDYDEIFVDAGYFNDSFKGKISIDFSDTSNDLVMLKVKASTGVMSSPNIQCDDEFTINIEEGYEVE